MARADALGIEVAPYTRVSKIEDAIAQAEAALLTEAAPLASSRPEAAPHDPKGGSYPHAHR